MTRLRGKPLAARLPLGAALLLLVAAGLAVPLSAKTVQQVPSTVVYRAGWNLIAGLPGMDLTSARPQFYPLQPGDTDYETARSSAELKRGAGYWANFTVDSPLVLPAGAGDPYTVVVPAGQYVMVGNPSGKLPATVEGADDVLAYDPATGYASTTTLEPGRGAWVFSAAGGAVTVRPDSQSTPAAGIGSPVSSATPVPTQLAPSPGQRATVDQPDDRVGPQIHLMYVLPSDGIDRALDTNGTIARSVAAFQTWLAGQTGGRRLRIDTYQGKTDVTFFRLSQSDADVSSSGAFVRDLIERELHRAGFNEPEKLYAVFYDGSSNFACGGGAWPPVLPGNTAALYLHGRPPGFTPCDANRFAADETRPGYWEFSLIHEILHTMGFVARCAPHQILAGHVSTDPRDLMYAGPLPWRPSVLDPGHTDYFAHGNQDCPDLARSNLLE